MKPRHRFSPRKESSSELAVRQFVRAWGLFHERMRPYFARFGISGAQWGVLRTLQRAEEASRPPLRLTDVGERLLVRPPSVTGVVDLLERKGLVLRRPAPSDSRAKEVVLTSAGRRLVGRVLRHHPAQLRSILSGFTESEARQLQRWMKRMADHLEDLGPRDGTRSIGAR